MSAANSKNRQKSLPTVYKRIALKTARAELAAAIQSSHKLLPLTARILAARGYGEDQSALSNFLEPTLARGLPPPSQIKGLEKAVTLLQATQKKGDGLAIACDFDVDGLSSGAQVYDLCLKAGIPAKVFVPDRFSDGYGLNTSIIDQAAAEGFGTLLCLDFGTTNHHELAHAKGKGLRTIVLDHHHVVSPPPADAFINPQQEGCNFADGLLCSAGLTWYLVAALRKALTFEIAPDPKQYLEIACLGTICDMVPLIGPNRVLAKRGLEALSVSTRPGLIALREVAGVKQQASCSDVSFGIGPRINAAGRIENATSVIELLTTPDINRARMIARKLDTLNRERQDTEMEVKYGALAKLQERQQLGSSLVVWDSEFHTGVVGIVAQRLVEQFYRPAVVLGQDSPGIFKGSVRGVKNFSVVESLAACGELLLKFGGHEGAGGLSIKEEHLPAFATMYEEVCSKALGTAEPTPTVDADTTATLDEISVELVEELSSLAPFGMGNPNPLVLTRNLKVSSVTLLKEAHLKFGLTDGTRTITGLMWRTTVHPAVSVGAVVDVAYRPDYNNYNGLTELQAHVVSVQLA